MRCRTQIIKLIIKFTLLKEICITWRKLHEKVKNKSKKFANMTEEQLKIFANWWKQEREN